MTMSSSATEDQSRDGHQDGSTQSRKSISIPSKTSGDVEKIKPRRKVSASTSSSSFNMQALAGVMLSNMSRRRINHSKMSHRHSSYSRFSFRPAQHQITRKMENSYQLGPTDQTRFSPAKVKTVIQDSLHFYLSDKTSYHAREWAGLSRAMADDIKSRVKLLGYTRYKLVVQVNIGQHLGQGLEVASRCIWDTDNDNSATAVYETGDIFAIASVFGVYFE